MEKSTHAATESPASTTLFSKLKDSDTTGALLLRNAIVGLVGVAVMLASDYLSPGSFWGKLLEHVGTGIVVAAVAVFSYEHRAQLKKFKETLATVTAHMAEQVAAIEEALTKVTAHTADQMAALTTATSTQISTLDSVANEQVTRLIAATESQVNELSIILRGEAELAVPKVLTKAFADTNPEHELLGRTSALVSAVMQMGKRHSWLDDVSLRFISELLYFVSTNATKLARSATEKGYSFSLELPLSASYLADKILSEEMRTLTDGDSYTVVSDFGSWRGALNDFLTENIKAADRDVVIRRVFCKFTYDAKLQQAEASEILRQHWNAANASKPTSGGGRRYEVGVLPASQTGVHPTHRGVFQHGGVEVSFEPKDDTLRYMRVSQMEADLRIDDDMDRLWLSAIRSVEAVPESGEMRDVTFTEALQKLGESWWQPVPRIAGPLTHPADFTGR